MTARLFIAQADNMASLTRNDDENHAILRLKTGERQSSEHIRHVAAPLFHCLMQ